MERSAEINELAAKLAKAQAEAPRTFNSDQYSDGVFIAMTGGMVQDFMPQDKQAGFAAATNGLSQTEKVYWWDYCITRLGYVDPFSQWSDRHTGGTIL
jgi:hypothetical protein